MLKFIQRKKQNNQLNIQNTIRMRTLRMRFF